LAVFAIGFFAVPDAFAYEITDGANGGDCTQIGIWDASSKTCTLTTDISEGITIVSNYITLDGNGHSITGQNPTSDSNWDTRMNEVFGIFASTKTNLIIKNVETTNWYHGIYLQSVVNSVIQDSTSTNNYVIQIKLSSSNYNTVSNNVVPCGSSHPSMGTGITSYYGEGNDILGNTITGCSDTGIELISADNSIVSNNVVDQEGNTPNNSGAGISVNQGSDYATITGNTVTNAFWGIEYSGSQGGTVQNNIVSNNQGNGLTVSGSGVTVSDNTISNNGVGLVVSNGNFVYHNNLISNTQEGAGSGNYGATLNNSGGNYWSDYAPNCADNNYDNF